MARIKADDPAYGVAREMGETLKGLGVAVRCVCASKMQHVFEGQLGAAWYRSDEGIFDIMFLPKGKSFEALKVEERRENGRFIYSFQGSPRGVGSRWDSAKPEYFIKRGNMLLVVWGDEKLAEELRRKVGR